VTECHLLTVKSLGSNFWPEGIILSFFRQVFLWMSREKSDSTTIKKYSTTKNEQEVKREA
jgi:hypothetical protein